MPKTTHRIIVDTNLWISFLLTKDFSRLDHLFATDHLKLLFSKLLLAESVEVAQRPKFKKYFSLPDLEELLLPIEKKAKFVTVTSTVDLCRDPKDNFLLALALDGKATHLLTGDNDLLVLKRLNKTRILSITDYLAGQ